MFRIVTCVVLLSLASAKILHRFTDCGGSHGTIHSLQFTPCADNMAVCKLVPGQRYTAHINFTAHEDSLTATNVVTGMILNSPVPWAGISPNECGQGLRCPVTAGLRQTYVASVVCPHTAPVTLVVKWEVRNDQGNAFICALFPLIVGHE